MSRWKTRKALILLALLRRRRARRNKSASRTVGIRSIFRRRREQGEYHNLLQELRLSDPDSHFKYIRMSREVFDNLLEKVSPLLTHRFYGKIGISSAERLALTLRYLATGNSQVSLSFNYRIGRSTVCGILKEVCQALWDVLIKDYLKAPSSVSEWKGISKQFERMWNFPHCIGSIDGKHVVIQAPANCGSTFFNYKGSHSIILLAVCDAHYRFTLVDIGEAGRHSDGGVLSNSKFGQALENNTLSIPEPCPLPGMTQPLPYAIVGDEAFPLRANLLCPYPGRNLPENRAVFNYHLSHARRVIENSFGILASRWRFLHTPIIAHPDHVILFVKAAIVLHNYLRTEESNVYCPPGFLDSEDGCGNLVEGG